MVEAPSATILVDSGCGADALLELRGRVDAVVYTHHHPDHISGHHLLEGRVRVFSPAGEEAYPSLELLARRFAGDRYAHWLAFATRVIGVRTVPRADEYYAPGEDVCFRGVCLKTVPARGHMLTHTLLELPGRWLHCSDIDLTGFGPWFGNPESDPLLFLSDVEAAASLDASRYTTSHRGDVLDRPRFLEELAAYVMRLAGALERLLELLGREGPLDEARLTGRGVLYRRYVPGAEELMEFFERTMVRKLLGLLYAFGCVARVRGGFEARGSCRAVEWVREVAERVRSMA